MAAKVACGSQSDNYFWKDSYGAHTQPTPWENVNLYTNSQVVNEMCSLINTVRNSILDIIDAMNKHPKRWERRKYGIQLEYAKLLNAALTDKLSKYASARNVNFPELQLISLKENEDA